MITSGPLSEMSVCKDYERCCVEIEHKNKKYREKKVNKLSLSNKSLLILTVFRQNACTFHTNICCD